MGGCARPETLMGPCSPPPTVWLPWALFPAAYVLESGGKGRRAGPAQGVHRCPVPTQHSSCPPIREAARRPGAPRSPRGPVATALVPGSGSLMSYGI